MSVLQASPTASAPSSSRSLAGSAARRALRDGAVVAGLLFTAYLFVVVAPRVGTLGFDAFAYWSIDLADPYRAPVGGLAAFNYSPPIALLFAPAGLLPWHAFLTLWLGVLIATVIWLPSPRRRVVWLLAFPPVALELYHGNVHLLMAAAIALGFRYPAAWSFVLLTKVTPGIGLIWFAVRREWRSLALALGATLVAVVVSVALDPSLWTKWLGLLASTGDGGTVVQFQVAIPLWLRLPAAFALVAWGARTDRRWTVPIAATLALPILWVSGFAICAALVHSELRVGHPISRSAGRPVGRRVGDPVAP